MKTETRVIGASPSPSSAGGTAATALQIAETAPEGSVLLAMLPDTGERYFSSPLFADINEGSDDEWLASLG